MNILLLIFFALPIAVIIVSIALQKILKCPFLVASIIFAIFLVVTFIIGDLIFLVATIVYSIIAFITAVVTKIICRILRGLDERGGRRERCNCFSNVDDDNNNGNLLTISSSGCNGVENELLTINSSCPSRNNENDCNNNDSCSCNCNTSNNTIAVRANVFPNNNNGRSGNFCGSFRRR